MVHMAKVCCASAVLLCLSSMAAINAARGESLGVRITSSSEMDSAPAFLAADGDIRMSWIPRNQPQPNWICFDLQSPQRVSTLEFIWQPGLNESTYTVEISADGAKWRSVADGESGNEKPGTILTIKNEPQARFVRLNLKGSRQGVSEVRINGKDLYDPSARIPAVPADAPYKNRQLSPEARGANLVSLMTRYEKFQIVGGYRTMRIRGSQRLGLRDVALSDASAGLHMTPERGIDSPGTIAYPCIVALTATWDPQRVQEYGMAVGQECRLNGIDVLLGPGFNLYRTSTCGRNFEYMGEDPFLASMTAVDYILGIQRQGVVATAKHFVCNNQEWKRSNADVIVDERTLHEFYMLPWYYAVNKAHVGAIMGAYNWLNGEKICASNMAINGLLRKEIGFDGLVMSDWAAAIFSDKVLGSGLDLSMPVTRSQEKLYNSITPETMPQLDAMVRRIVTTMFRMGIYDRDAKLPELADRRSSWQNTALNVARDSVTLLKNNGALPLSADNIVVTGPSATKTCHAGKGSGWVEGYGHTHIGPELQRIMGARRVTVVDDWKKVSDAALRDAGQLVVCVDRQTRESNDYPPNLDEDQERLVRRAVSLNPRAVIVVNSGSGLEMDWDEQASAVVWAYYPGQYGATAIAEVLAGQVNPSGKLPYTIERRFTDSPAYGYIPEGANWKSERFSKKNDVDRTLPANPKIEYKEGIFVGYRWYDRKNIKVRYPFGHGLSYTTFDYSNIQVTVAPQGIDVSATLTNTGARSGREIIELYVGAENAGVPRPARELKAYRKIELNPGESRLITFNLTPQALAYYDVPRKNWRVDPGAYRVDIGASSRDIRLTRTITWNNAMRYQKPTDDMPKK